MTAGVRITRSIPLEASGISAADSRMSASSATWQAPLQHSAVAIDVRYFDFRDSSECRGISSAGYESPAGRNVRTLCGSFLTAKFRPLT